MKVCFADQVFFADNKRTWPQAQARKINDTTDRLSEDDRANRAAQLQRTMGLLLHVSRCHDAQCPSTNCRRIKQLFEHAVKCQIKVSGGCTSCRCASEAL